jgi:transcriptional regulator GlxA family with amidase domain
MTIRTFMSDNLETEITVGDIADSVGVSIRTLQKGFVDHYFMSPKQMLKIMRLDKARELLKARRSHVHSVNGACKAVGYGHAGRFSKEYADRFGETPSETLKLTKALSR